MIALITGSLTKMGKCDGVVSICLSVTAINIQLTASDRLLAGWTLDAEIILNILRQQQQGQQKYEAQQSALHEVEYHLVSVALVSVAKGSPLATSAVDENPRQPTLLQTGQARSTGSANSPGIDG